MSIRTVPQLAVLETTDPVPIEVSRTTTSARHHRPADPYPEPVSESRRGLAFGIGAYTLWGSFPLYWPLLKPAGAGEILAHRILWSAIAMALLVLLMGRRRQFAAILRDRRTTLLLAFAACAVSLNWLLYVWAVNNGRVVETSLGYFINPLVTVLLGVFVLGEQLRRLQWVAMVVAAAAVGVLTFDYHRLPWVALALACSFGIYGLLKKLAEVGAVESLSFETLLLAPVAGGFLAWLAFNGQAAFGSYGAGHAGLLATTGLVTALPLLLFGAAAIRVSLTALGLMQYLAPTIQFALGVFWFREEMSTGRWLGFGLVWVALVMFTVEAVQHRRRQLRLAAEASAL